MSLTTTTTTLSCFNPYDFLLQQAVVLHEGGSFDTICDAIVYILDEGVYTTSCNFCCPDCSGGPLPDTPGGTRIPPFFGTTETFLKYWEAVGLTQSQQPLSATDFPNCVDNICCLNIYAEVETYRQLYETIGPITLKKTCCNNVEQCVLELIGLDENCSDRLEFLEHLLYKGIIEYGRFDGLSAMCLLKESIKKYIIGKYECISEIVKVILDIGVVIACNNGEATISAPDTYFANIQ